MPTDEDEFDPWWRRALCRELGDSLFFLNDGENGVEAKQACSMCEVRVQCLADSLKSDLPYGIFGGFGRDVRRFLARAVERGADPQEVARKAIEREEQNRAAARAADHGGDVARGRDRDRVRPAPEGHPEERPRVAAQRADPAPSRLRGRDRGLRGGPRRALGGRP